MTQGRVSKMLTRDVSGLFSIFKLLLVWLRPLAIRQWMKYDHLETSYNKKRIRYLELFPRFEISLVRCSIMSCH